MSRDIPIIFSSAMIHALLADRKTMTRRLALTSKVVKREVTPKSYRSTTKISRSPWCNVTAGDRLWVRENFARNANQLSDDRMDISIVYAADNKGRALDNGTEKPWTPCIHMPRTVSRLTLIVTAVKIERLQDISEADAEAEGCPPCPRCNDVGWINSGPDGGWQCDERGCGDAHSEQFRRLWSSLHGADSWNANPEVVALTFRVIKSNIDATKARAA